MRERIDELIEFLTSLKEVLNEEQGKEVGDCDIDAVTEDAVVTVKFIVLDEEKALKAISKLDTNQKILAIK